MIDCDWQGVYEFWDEMDKIDQERFWRREKDRFLTELEELEADDARRPAGQGKKGRLFGFFRRERECERE